MEKEQWKKIEGFKFYEVSNYGRVRSLSRQITRNNPRWKTAPKQKITVGGKLLKGWISSPSKNYLRKKVALRKNGKTYEKMVHSLVLTAFVGKGPKGMEACHNNGNPLDNYYKNLRWDTHQSNMADAEKHGTKRLPPVHSGESHPNSTISDEDVSKIRSMKYVHGLYASLSKEYNVALNTISRIYTGKSRMVFQELPGGGDRR